MTNDIRHYRQLLESDSTPAWVQHITPTPTGPVAVFHQLNYKLRLSNHNSLKVTRIELDVSTGIIRVYFSLDSTGTVAADKQLVGLDQALMPLFTQVFAPYDLGDVHRAKHVDFIRYDTHEVYVTYGSYYLSGQVSQAWHTYLDGMDYETQLNAVKSDPDYIRFIDEPDEQLQMAAIKTNPYSIQNIDHPTDAVQIAAITDTPATLMDIQYPTVLLRPDIKTFIIKYLLGRMKINAVFHTGFMIKYLREHGIDWSELDIIEKSLATAKLNEDDSETENTNIETVKRNGFDISRIKNPSLAVQLAAVKNNGSSIQFIDNPSLEVQIAAVNNRPISIHFIKKPSANLFTVPEIKHALIKRMLQFLKNDDRYNLIDFYYLLKEHNVNWPELDMIRRGLPDKKLDEAVQLTDINSQTEAGQIEWVRDNRYAIKWIDNPSELVQLTAVRQDPYTLQSIKNPTELVKLTAVKKSGSAIQFIKDPSLAVQLAAGRTYPFSITLIDNPSSELFLDADFKHSTIKHLLADLKDGNNYSVREFISILRRRNVNWPELDIISRGLEPQLTEAIDVVTINNASEAEQLAAVQQNGYVIQLIKNPSLAVQLAAVQQNGYSIQCIKNPREVVKIAAVRSAGRAIEYITDPSEAVQLAAVQQMGGAIHGIFKPSNAVKLAAVKQNPFIIRREDYSNKPVVITAILGMIKQNSQDSAMDVLYSVKRKHPDWPELDIIEKSLNADQITEAVKGLELDNASEAEQIAAVRDNGFNIELITNPSEAVKLAAVEQSGYYIQYINNPSEAVQLAAVSNYGTMLYYIKNPSEAVQLAAVQQDGVSIRCIKNPSMAVKLAAVKQYPFIISDLGYSNKQLVITALLLMIKQERLDDARRVLKMANSQNPKWPELIAIERSLNSSNLTEAVKNRALNNASEAEQIAAVTDDPSTICYINNPSEAVQMAAVQEDGYYIQIISNPSEAVQLAAVSNYGCMVRHIKNPSEAVQMTAVQQDGAAIQCIKNPSMAVKLAAVKQYPALVTDLHGFSDKQLVITALLVLIKQDRLAKARRVLEFAISHHPEWPELDVIATSLTSSKPG